MAKKHHMTKHQYNAYKRDHRQYTHALNVEEEKVRQGKSTYDKYRKKSDKNVKHLLQNIKRHSDDFFDEEEYDDEYDLKAIKALGGVKTRKARLHDLEQYES